MKLRNRCLHIDVPNNFPSLVEQHILPISHINVPVARNIKDEGSTQL